MKTELTSENPVSEGIKSGLWAIPKGALEIGAGYIGGYVAYKVSH
jgi:hypothetical protein